MSLDASVPLQLHQIQEWFGQIISRPLINLEKIQPLSPSGIPIEQEAWQYITPSPTLLPHQRIELYNQQYWWRLLRNLQDNYPFVTRLFGYHDFNELIAIPYFKKNIPNHWQISTLGYDLPYWAENNYFEKDRQLIIHAAIIDRAYVHSFLAKKGKDPDEQSLPSCQLTLQPYVHLFSLPYDLFANRSAFLKQSVEYWLEHDFPLLKNLNPEDSCFILYRNHHNDIVVESLTTSQFKILSKLKTPLSIDSLCLWLEESDLAAEASEKLQEWFQYWTFRKWICEN